MISASDIKITSPSNDTVVDEFGKVQEYVRIFYVIGDHGPYDVRIPKLEATAQRVLMDVRADAQRWIDIINLQF